MALDGCRQLNNSEDLASDPLEVTLSFGCVLVSVSWLTACRRAAKIQVFHPSTNPSHSSYQLRGKSTNLGLKPLRSPLPIRVHMRKWTWPGRSPYTKERRISTQLRFEMQSYGGIALQTNCIHATPLSSPPSTGSHSLNSGATPPTNPKSNDIHCLDER